MSKEVRNMVIVAVIALLVGYIAGGVIQTGRCPITGKVVCAERAAACDKMKACAVSCETKSGDAQAPEAAPSK